MRIIPKLDFAVKRAGSYNPKSARRQQQSFRQAAHTAELLDPGDYRVVVETRGGNPDGTIRAVDKPVKHLKVTPPVPTVEVTAVNGQGGEDDVFIFWDGDKQLTFVVTSRGGVAASEPQVVEHDVAFGG